MEEKREGQMKRGLEPKEKGVGIVILLNFNQCQ